MSDTVLGQPVTAIRTRNPISTRPEALAMEFLGDMNARKIGAVVDEENGPFQVMADPEGNEFCFITED